MTSFFGVPPVTVAAWMAAAVGAILLVLVLFGAINRILVRMALRNIPRRRAQSTLILFGLMLATLIITASLAVGDTSSYSLQSIEVRQMAGIDAAFTRTTDYSVQGAGQSNGDFFTPDQAASVTAMADDDANVAATSGAIVARGSMIDLVSGQTSSENVAVWGVGPDFGAVWGPLRSSDGATLNVAGLSPSDVIVGSSLARHLNARVGDSLQLYVASHPVQVTVRGILDTEVNPSISLHGPIVNSVVMPLAEMRSLVGRPGGYNVVLVHFKGSGGLDDLGPNGATGDAVTRHMRAQLTDPQAAAELWSYLDTPAVKAQVRKIRDQASFLDPDKDFASRLLVELDKPAVSDEFKALVANRFVDRVLLQAVEGANPPDQAQAVDRAFEARVNALHVDNAAAGDLKALLSEPALEAALRSAAGPGDLGQAFTTLLDQAAQPTLTAEFKATAGNTDVQHSLETMIRTAAPARLDAYLSIERRLNISQFQAYKADAVTFAQQGGIVATGGLLAVSFFSICVGVLLIFLIFVMLAAERRAEMGMSRAVGLKRRHLTQMFLFEGAAYTLAASLIGVVLGVGVGFLMTGVLSTIFANFYPGFTLQYHVEWTSLVIAACLGVLLTFGVVAVSAYRVSRLNIVAAIRDLDESESKDAGMRRMFTDVFATASFGIRQLFRGHPVVFVHRLTLGLLGSIRTFWWALFRRGPMTVSLGVALAYAGSLIEVELVYLAGVSLLIVGVGLLLRWVLTMARVRYGVAARAGFTATAIGLLVYWGQPFGRVEKLIHVDGRGTLEHIVRLDQMTGGPEVFALSALMVLLGVIWLVMYNSDLLIRGVMFFTGRFAGLAAVTRTSMAYPMSTKFRTGMAVAMFGIVTFVIVFMSIFQDVLLQNFANVNQLSGGWQIVAGTPDFNYDFRSDTTFPSDIAATVAGNPTTAADIRAVGWENVSTAAYLRRISADGTVPPPQNPGNLDFMDVRVVDDSFLTNTTYDLAPRASGYNSDRAVWEAVRDNVGYAVVDASVLDASNGRAATISGVGRHDSSFTPFQVEADRPDGTKSTTAWHLTVVGFMPHTNWQGIYISERTALASGLFTEGGKPAVKPTGYYFAVRPGVDVNTARLDLGRLLASGQIEPAIVADEVAQQVGGFVSLLKLMTGFLALGLIVGIAGLGVISTRAVVERWQQIGMLRALGYRRSLVQRSFLMESSFIAVIGLLVGTAVGVWQSYTFFVTNQTFGSVDFHIPAVQILLILVGAYAATLVTTYLPSRAAARVAPAEALRYE